MGPAPITEKTSAGAIKTSPGHLVSLVLTPAAAVATVTLYDNTAASGTVLVSLQAAANGNSVPFAPPRGIAFNACYLDISGSGAKAYVQSE